jgi:hypothetical protein
LMPSPSLVAPSGYGIPGARRSGCETNIKH